MAGREALEAVTCVTAQHRGLLDQVLDIADITPDFDLDVMEPNQSLDRLTARLLTGVGEVLDRESFDRVVVQGDTATAMTAALAAYYRKIPVAHVEAGLRSGDIYHPWPEEVNRRMISTIADLHFAPTETAAAALRREGISDHVHVTGNTVIDALHATCAAIERNPDLVIGLETVREQALGRKLVLVTTHRRENFGEGMEQIAAAIAQISQRDDVLIVFPVHPNPSVTSVMDRMLANRPNVLRMAPLDYPSFVAALSMAYLVLTDSGGVQEEAPALGKPVLVMRETTERPEGIAAGTARLVSANTGKIVEEVTRLFDNGDAYTTMARAHNPFGDGRAAQRIAGLIIDRAAS
jgi:UDP-N-acetylglucosamine 2-epimerase (non-hydrolysing)